MDRYNWLILESLHVDSIERAKGLLTVMLNEREYRLIELIVFDDKSLTVVARELGTSYTELCLEFRRVLRKIYSKAACCDGVEQDSRNGGRL